MDHPPGLREAVQLAENYFEKYSGRPAPGYAPPPDDLLESFALVETALADILKTEKERLQKAVQNTDNFCNLLEINQSVQTTLAQAVLLEHTLSSRLEAVCLHSRKP